MEDLQGSGYCFTIFTPTFNRAHLLQRAFESLRVQSFMDFEWIVVDDGSTDGTKELVEGLGEKADFPVRYFWQENSGKHVAINRGVKEAKGYFFVILDSDDWLAENCLERLLYHWKRIPETRRESFTGIVGLWADPSGKVIGTPFPEDRIDTDSIEIRTKYRVKGDNFGINRTEVMREFPFPEDLGRFVTESLVWNRIARKYKKRYVNEILAIKDFQKGGLTDTGLFIQINSPLATRTYHKENMQIASLPMEMRLRSCVNYVRFSFHGHCGLKKQFSEAPMKFHWVLCFFLGFYAYMRDLKAMEKRTGQEEYEHR